MTGKNSSREKKKRKKDSNHTIVTKSIPTYTIKKKSNIRSFFSNVGDTNTKNPPSRTQTLSCKKTLKNQTYV